MAYAFRIHEAKQKGVTSPTSAANMSGWTQTSHIAGNLLNNITIGRNANKTGTSIPSIFARLFLFEGAFQVLAGATINRLNAVDADTCLISECLDLLEFLFQHGNDSNLVIKHWNVGEQIQCLRTDGNSAHIKLAKVLEDETRGRQLNDIYLFYWKATSPQSIMEKDYLIGGTSPYTLVFTSPNWKRMVSENNFHFNRINGKPMFTNGDAESLISRDSQFKDMLYSLRMAYQKQLDAQANWFSRYLATMWSNDVKNPDVMAMGTNPGAFMGKYSSIRDSNGANVMSAALPLCYLRIVPTASGYEIVPKSNRYANYTTSTGQPIQLQPPLALNNNGLTNVRYIGNSQWDAQTCRINEAVVRTTPIHQRIVPGNAGVQYPFLIWSDFLEDKIIKLPYLINRDKFVTASAGDTHYVLPLKREFFKYFNIEDISMPAYVGANSNLVEVVAASDGSVTVTINVPIHDTTYHSIEFKKTYIDTDIVNSEFILGFFPFYRCNIPALNRYSVMNCGNDPSLNFVSINNINGMINSPSVERTTPQQLTCRTEYYTIKQDFDLVEVVVKNVKGVIIPKMTNVSTVNPNNHYDFAVDFGTSNTYIAHRTLANANNGPQSFEIDENDQQTVFLNQSIELGTYMYVMRPYIDREFSPAGLGKNYGISYPSRTATCEVPNFENRVPELFGTISIGFNMMREPQVPNGSFQYKTGLKWLLDNDPGNQHHTNRIKYYFLQTLWMMKNESLLNGGGDAFDVYLTFPQSMRNQQALISLWNWAIQELQLQNCRLHNGPQYSESIAPYNCMAAKIGGNSYLNIDIGGGTNDLLFVVKDANGQIQNSYYSSAKFAGDDLWGDGVQILNNQGANNGFVAYITRRIDEADGVYPPDVLNPLTALRQGLASSSADIMSYLFKHDATFATSDKIKGQRNLWSLVFIHYAAIMYNVARLIKKLQIEIPERISFTGMGSKYINLISANDGIRSLTVLLLQKYTGKEVSKDFQIINAGDTDVKEITAKGVLQGINFANQNFAIPENTLQPILDYGFDSKVEITYADVKNENGEVRKQALDEFNHFVESLKEKDFRNFLFQNYRLNISEELFEDLKTKANASFTTMSASTPAQFDQLNLVETLFFWPLKNALVELSKNFGKYN